MRTLFTGGRFISPAQTQWAPTLTSHDPNPPITLETAAVSAITGLSAFAFAVAGNLTGTGALAGSSTMTFSVAGTLIALRKSLIYKPTAARLMPLMHF